MKDYKDVFEKLVNGTEDYVKNNGLKSLVLGISGGIDSTVVAAIANEVSNRLGIPFIGRSLPCKTNGSDEVSTATMVGSAFCTDFKEVSIQKLFETFKPVITESEGDKCWSDISQGNIKARLRMIYLYHLASNNCGIVLDTDNLSEHYLGFFTIHGDVADFNPIGDLWKTEVYGLAKWLVGYYANKCIEDRENNQKYCDMSTALHESIKLTPTDGNGVASGGDMAQIAPGYTYTEVDEILRLVIKHEIDECYGRNTFENIVDYKNLCNKYGKETVDRVISRYRKSEFKRKHMPIVIRIKENPSDKLLES